jgi:hypothetical protein
MVYIARDDYQQGATVKGCDQVEGRAVRAD